MFDIGFWELAVIAVVALLVFGPKDLPKVVRTVAASITRVRNFMHNVGVQLDEEVGRMEDLQRLGAKAADAGRPREGRDPPGPKPAAEAPGAEQGERAGQRDAGPAATQPRADPPAGQSHNGTR